MKPLIPARLIERFDDSCFESEEGRKLLKWNTNSETREAIQTRQTKLLEENLSNMKITSEEHTQQLNFINAEESLESDWLKLSEHEKILRAKEFEKRATELYQEHQDPSEFKRNHAEEVKDLQERKTEALKNKDSLLEQLKFSLRESIDTDPKIKLLYLAIEHGHVWEVNGKLGMSEEFKRELSKEAYEQFFSEISDSLIGKFIPDPEHLETLKQDEQKENAKKVIHESGEILKVSNRAIGLLIKIVGNEQDASKVEEIGGLAITTAVSLATCYIDPSRVTCTALANSLVTVGSYAYAFGKGIKSPYDNLVKICQVIDQKLDLRFDQIDEELHEIIYNISNVARFILRVESSLAGGLKNIERWLSGIAVQITQSTVQLSLAQMDQIVNVLNRPYPRTYFQALTDRDMENDLAYIETFLIKTAAFFANPQNDKLSTIDIENLPVFEICEKSSFEYCVDYFFQLLQSKKLNTSSNMQLTNMGVFDFIFRTYYGYIKYLPSKFLTPERVENIKAILKTAQSFIAQRSEFNRVLREKFFPMVLTEYSADIEEIEATIQSEKTKQGTMLLEHDRTQFRLSVKNDFQNRLKNNKLEDPEINFYSLIKFIPKSHENPQSCMNANEDCGWWSLPSLGMCNLEAAGDWNTKLWNRYYIPLKERHNSGLQGFLRKLTSNLGNLREIDVFSSIPQIQSQLSQTSWFTRSFILRPNSRNHAANQILLESVSLSEDSDNLLQLAEFLGAGEIVFEHCTAGNFIIKTYFNFKSGTSLLLNEKIIIKKNFNNMVLKPIACDADIPTHAFAHAVTKPYPAVLPYWHNLKNRYSKLHITLTEVQKEDFKIRITQELHRYRRQILAENIVPELSDPQSKLYALQNKLQVDSRILKGILQLAFPSEIYPEFAQLDVWDIESIKKHLLSDSVEQPELAMKILTEYQNKLNLTAVKHTHLLTENAQYFKREGLVTLTLNSMMQSLEEHLPSPTQSSATIASCIDVTCRQSTDEPEMMYEDDSVDIKVKFGSDSSFFVRAYEIPSEKTSDLTITNEYSKAQTSGSSTVSPHEFYVLLLEFFSIFYNLAYLRKYFAEWINYYSATPKASNAHPVAINPEPNPRLIHQVLDYRTYTSDQPVVVISDSKLISKTAEATTVQVTSELSLEIDEPNTNNILHTNSQVDGIRAGLSRNLIIANPEQRIDLSNSPIINLVVSQKDNSYILGPGVDRIVVNPNSGTQLITGFGERDKLYIISPTLLNSQNSTSVPHCSDMMLTEDTSAAKLKLDGTEVFVLNKSCKQLENHVSINDIEELQTILSIVLTKIPTLTDTALTSAWAGAYHGMLAVLGEEFLCSIGLSRKQASWASTLFRVAMMFYNAAYLTTTTQYCASSLFAWLGFSHFTVNMAGTVAGGLTTLTVEAAKGLSPWGMAHLATSLASGYAGSQAVFFVGNRYRTQINNVTDYLKSQVSSMLHSG